MEKESKKKKSGNLIILKMLIVLLIIFLVGLTIYKFNIYDKKVSDNNITQNENKQENDLKNNEISYEIKEEEHLKKLYVNGNKSNVFINKKYDMNVEQIEDILIVFTKESDINTLYIVDKNGTTTEFDYKEPDNTGNLENSVKSYKIVNNTIYIKVERVAVEVEWYCYYKNKEEIVEYEIEYEYVEGKFIKKEITNEISIKEKYKNDTCKYIGANRDNTIKYELLYDDEMYYALYVNDKKTIASAGWDWEIEEFKDVIIVSLTQPGGVKQVTAINKNGEMFDFDCNVKVDNSNYSCNIQSYKIEDNSVYISSSQWNGLNGLFDWYCYVENKDYISKYTIKYDYIENGKFKFDKTLNEIKFKDAYNYEECKNTSTE